MVYWIASSTTSFTEASSDYWNLLRKVRGERVVGLVHICTHFQNYKEIGIRLSLYLFLLLQSWRERVLYPCRMWRYLWHVHNNYDVAYLCMRRDNRPLFFVPARAKNSRESKRPSFNTHTNIGFLVVDKRQTIGIHPTQVWQEMIYKTYRIDRYHSIFSIQSLRKVRFSLASIMLTFTCSS